MDQALVQRIEILLRENNRPELQQILEQEDARTIANAISEFSGRELEIFAMLPPEKQATAAMFFSDTARELIFSQLSDLALARFFYFLDEDNATDILQQLPSVRHNDILQHVHQDKRLRIEKLLKFGPETAGGLMDLNFLELPPETKINDVIDTVQKYTKEHKRVPTVIFQAKEGVRWAPARTLVTSPNNIEVARVSREVPTILHSADREEVLELMGKENSDIISVIDENQKILGIIHMNDILRIARVEASEDLYRMGAVGRIDASYLESKFFTIWKKRVGWLSILFVAELFTFTALSRFESSIAAVTALALFVPLAISTGGNSGSQAATIITRAMALGHITARDWWRVFRHELFMGIALGVALGLIGFLRAYLTPQHILGPAERLPIGLVIGLSVASICLWGTLVGSMLPIIFKKLGIDPAYASSPFVATFVDVTGITIYFSIASVFILH
ncbi:MAG: magnesium transporter [Parcubacteria group bacterium Gr01-1014_13]|nr:MAG: magnesium transporter [Parcubacteria group bacterium Gr01-1014_13]